MVKEKNTNFTFSNFEICKLFIVFYYKKWTTKKKKGYKMRFAGKLLLLSSLTTLGFSEVTICFKKNHNDISTIENVKLDGGVCAGQKSQIQMQKEGWKFENLQVKNDGYLFIFKKSDEKVQISKDTEKSLETKILAKLEKKKEEEIKISKQKAKDEKIDLGKKLYVNKCSSCHGQKAQIEVGNAKALNSISLEHFQKAISGYKLGVYNLGSGREMRAYSVGYTSSDVENIYNYIQKIK